ncbi:MAG TPA: MauE/DoxX family redox-associated membrane protein [Actinomycetota bacterium]|jgi:hypothetical protein|nr:MauE/DoxX family redox-associated membrane protein [Actinomycetota bacterium]
MVETITPVVYGGRARWTAAFALHVAGATASAAMFGLILGGVGSLLGAPWGRAGAIALAAAAAVYALGELPRITATVPQLRRQVPDWWREFFSWPVAATLYGAGLGIGFFTYLSHGTLVVVALAALASGDPLVGAIVVAPFGLARGLSAARASGVRTQEASQRLVDHLAETPERGRSIANGSALVVVGGLSLVTAAGAADGWGAFATAALALAFAWAAASKVADVRGWRRTLAAHGLPRGVGAAAVFGVPTAEALVPVLAVSGWPRAAAIWALVLLLVFTVEALRAWRRFGPHVPCGCFGGREAVSPAALLLRNAALAGLAATVALRPAPPPAFSWPGWPAPGEVLPMVLAIVGVGVAGFTAWTATKWLGGGARP